MIKESAQAKGVYTFKHIRDGVEIDSWTVDNIVPMEGRNYLFNAGVKGATAASSWYLACFQGNYTPVDGDTAATIASSATECTSYTEAARQLCDFSTSTASFTSNADNKANFTFNATVNVYGTFVASASAKNATTGILLSAARFPAVKSMTAGDVLVATYALSLTSA